MKKLICLLLILLPLSLQAKITITKSGDMVKITGLTKVNSPLAGNLTNTIYLNGIRQVTVNGNTIAFYQNKVPIVTFSFTELSDKAGQATAAAYVEYLIIQEIL